jgi:hypothetical protein
MMCVSSVSTSRESKHNKKSHITALKMRSITMTCVLALAAAAAPSSSSSAFAFAPIVSPAALIRPRTMRRASTSFVDVDFASTITSAFDYSALAASSSSSSSSVGVDILGENGIKIAFEVATFFPQLPWLFLILLPNAGITRKLLGGYGE